MGLLNNLFGGKNKAEKLSDRSEPWIPLESINQLDEIVGLSDNRPQVIFKHSTTCGVSRMALKQFVSEYDLSDNRVNLYLLDLRNFREVSNEVARRFGVAHESPQVLIIKSGKVAGHASHGAIGGVDLAAM